MWVFMQPCHLGRALFASLRVQRQAAKSATRKNNAASLFNPWKQSTACSPTDTKLAAPLRRFGAAQGKEATQRVATASQVGSWCV